MPTSTRSTGYRKKPSTEPAQTTPKPKAVVTIHSDGRVTATGPDAAAGKAEAEKSVARTTRVVAETDHKEHERPAPKSAIRPSKAGHLLAIVGSKLLTTPQQAYTEARTEGKLPGHDLERQYGRATRRKAERLALDTLKSKEGLKDDPAAELVIDTAATAGLGLGAKALGGIAEAGVGKLLASTGEKVAAKETSAAETAVEKGASKVIAKLRAAPKKKVQAVKSAPRRAKATAKRAPELKTKAGQKAAAKAAGKSTVKHPVKTAVPALAALPPGAEVNGIDPGQRARAFIEGTGDALLHHPAETLATTGHGVLGFLTAPVGLAAAGVSSVKQGSAAPLADEATTLAKGTLDLGKKLASGNPKEVEETTRKETGLTPFIPVPHLLKRVKGTKAYEDTVRGSLRGAVEGRRATTRDTRIAVEKAAQEGGEFVSRKRAKKIRKSVADSHRPGEHYVLRRSGKFIEKQRARHYVSRDVARMQEEGMFAGKRESESVAKKLRHSKGTDHSQQNDSDALGVILKHGLPLDHRTLDWARRLKEGYGSVEHGEIPAGVHLDRHSVQWILDHPDMFQGKRGAHLTKAVEEFDRQSEHVGTSERHRYLAQVLNVINPKRVEEGKHPILLPEEMILPETKRLLPKREEPWSRSQALTYAKNLKDREQAKKINQSLDGLMKPPEHGGAEGGISTTQSDAYTPEQEREFVRQASAEAARLGLRKPSAYVANHVPSGLKGEEKAPNYAAELPLRKIWPSRGIAAQSGNAESSFEALMHSSVEAPRARTAVVKGLNRIFDKASREVEGRRYLTEKQVEHAINTHKVPEGTLFLRTQALKSVLEGENTLDSEGFRQALEGEITNGQALASGQIASEMKDLKGVKGEKFAPVDAAAIGELMGHLQPLGKVTELAAHGTNFATRTILNSPAFAAIQIPQEGLPLAAALGSNVVHVPAAIRNLAEISKLPAEDQAAIKAVVGSSVGVLGAPSTKALRAEGYMNPIRAAGGTPAWRHAWNLVNGNTLGKFDRTRAGLFREIAADAKVQGDFRKASKGFAKWRMGANNLFKGEQQAVAEMKGMTRAERMAYVSSHPKLGDKLMTAMNDMAGNWNSFTVFEKHFAPLTVFYPFQRYSVLWMLYHFPLDHPAVATALTAMGQVNAQELQALAAQKGGSPSILDYTLPVVQNGEGKEPTVLPAGSRVFPGLSTVQQAALTKNPAALIGEASPPLAIGIEAATGKSAYTGLPIGENGFTYAARQAANLSPLLRFLGVPDTEQAQSTASKAFEALDPLKKYRSTLDPFIGQTAKQYTGTKQLEKGFDTKYGQGKIPGPFDAKIVQELLYGGPNDSPQPHLLPKVLKEIHEAEAASNLVKGKEAPFMPASKDFSETQKKLLEAVENAWQTGPNGETGSTSGGQYGKGAGQYSKGPGQYSKGAGQYSAGAGQYGG
jgi:hypothetical protein